MLKFKITDADIGDTNAIIEAPTKEYAVRNHFGDQVKVWAIEKQNRELQAGTEPEDLADISVYEEEIFDHIRDSLVEID
jgi:hypothetical protein